MSRTLYPPTCELKRISKIVPISEGGTDASDGPTAVANIGGIHTSDINNNLGVVGLDASGIIDTDAIRPIAGGKLGLKGDKVLVAGNLYTYEITNYDSLAVYVITATAGSVNRQGNILTFRAPASAGTCSVTINDEVYEFNVIELSVTKPVIKSPLNQSIDLPKSFDIVSSPYELIGSEETGVLLDPKLNNQLVASDAQASDSFGISVALNDTGTILVVGAYAEDTAGTNAGKVYIYDWNGSSWLERGTITASDAQTNDYFGRAVALNDLGDVIVVGATGEDTAGSNAGKVYIYDWNGSSWVERSTITASDAQNTDQFGFSLALDNTGTMLVVGANAEDTAATDAGKVYIYDWNGSAWIERGTITASDAEAVDYFGVSVALNSTGDILAVGAIGEDTAATDAGKVYIYDWNGSVWIERITITASDAQASDGFGVSLALDGTGTILAVGAFLEDTAATDAGKVYIYDWNGSVWIERITITASDAQVNAKFGRSIALIGDGSKIIVGAEAHDNVVTDTGKMYTYSINESNALLVDSFIYEVNQLVASNPQAFAYFGASVSVSNDGSIMAVGSYGESTAASDAGKVYIYDWNGSAWVERNTIIASDAQAGDLYGVSVALDSTGTILVVGAYAEDTAAADAGKVYIYDWNGSSWIERGTLTAGDAQASDFFGHSVALDSTGTILAVGAFGKDSSAVDAGLVYIYDWNGSAWITRGTVLGSDTTASDNFGISVALNGIGTILVVGAYTEDTAATDAGKVYIYDWNGSSWIERGTLTASNAEASDLFGMSACMNESGTVLVIGAIGKDSINVNSGLIYIYDWDGVNWIERGMMTSSDVPGESYGKSVSMNASGSKLIVGQHGSDDISTNAGKVYTYDLTYHASSDWELATDIDFTNIVQSSIGDIVNLESWKAIGLNEATDYYARVKHNSLSNGSSEWSLPMLYTTRATFMANNEVHKLLASDAQTSDQFGASVALNDTGTILVVGAQTEDTAGTNAGKVYIYDWNGTAWIERGTITASDGQSSDYFGRAVVFNGDGTILVVGAIGEDTAATDAGKVYIYDWNGSAWIERGTITASDAQTSDQFGASVALDGTGTILVVGAQTENTAGTNAGKVYIYDWNGSAWIERGTITASDAQTNDYFGVSVALNDTGTVLVVGAYTEDTAGTDAGKVYVYDWNGSTWIERGTITASDAQADDSFGVSVALDSTGTILVVGAYAEDTAAADAGKVYIYDWNGSSWVERGTIVASDAQVSDYFGISVALNDSGDVLIAGSFSEDTGATDAGAVYTYM